MAPDCDMSAAGPNGGITGANVALSENAGSALMTPRQLGPTMRMPRERTRSASARSRSAPSSPISRKPAVITTRPPTPASAHSPAMPNTRCFGTTMTARSTESGTEPMSGYARTEHTALADGFTG